MIRAVLIGWYKEIFQADQNGRAKYRWLDHMAVQERRKLRAHIIICCFLHTNVIVKRRRLISGVNKDVAEADPVGVLNQGGVNAAKLAMCGSHDEAVTY